MVENVLLVDPLAALFRAELAGTTPLMLDATEVEVEILSPLARVAVTRAFTNNTDRLLEVVLTLPPAAVHEVIYGLTVTINDRIYHAMADARRQAQRAYDNAIDQGRRAILYELVAGDVQLISIAGIEAGACVAVRVESILPLDLPEDGVAMLTIPLTADPNRINARLPDAEALRTVAAQHHASLAIFGDKLEVTLQGAGDVLASGYSYPIDCARPVSLRIVPLDGRTLDRTECAVKAPGGWEVSTGQHASTFFSIIHPSDAHRHVISGRTDWIFGQMGARYGEVWVTAPAPEMGVERPSAAARAMTAFAAEYFMESAVPCDHMAVQRAANILTRMTRLVFIGDEGELPDEVPVLRKLALPHDVPVIMSVREPQRVPLPDLDREELMPAPPSRLPPPLPSSEPGNRQPIYPWLAWGPIVLVVLWAIGQTQIVRLPLLPIQAAFVVLMILNALRFVPGKGEPARRRLPLLVLLAVPWIVSLLCSPLVLTTAGSDPASQNNMILFQQGLLGLSILLPVALLPALRGAWRLTGVVGILNVLATVLATTFAIIGNSPKS